MPRTHGQLQYGFYLPFARCWFRHRRNSVSSGQSLHRELDPAIAEIAPALDLGHVGGLWISLQNGPRAFTRLGQRQRKGFAPKTVGRLAASHYSICKVLWRPRHEISELPNALPNLCGRRCPCQQVPGPPGTDRNPFRRKRLRFWPAEHVQQIFCMFWRRMPAFVFLSHFREN